MGKIYTKRGVKARGLWKSRSGDPWEDRRYRESLVSFLGLLVLEAMRDSEPHCVLEHHAQAIGIRVHGGGVAGVAVGIREPVADAGDRHDNCVLASGEAVLLCKACEARRFRPAAHTNALHTGPVDLQPVARAFEVWAGAAHAVPNVHPVDGRTGEDAVHELLVNHAVWVREWRAIHGGADVLHKIRDDHDVALADVIAHATSGRGEDQLSDAQLPEDPHEQVHRIAIAFVHVYPAGNHEHSLSANHSDADLTGMPRKVCESIEERMNVRELDALDELSGLSPAGAENHGSVRMDLSK